MYTSSTVVRKRVKSIHMKKYYTIIGLLGVVLLVAGFMYFSFGGASRDIQKVISNDGLAELEIPKNSLPEGMSIKDISITNISVDDTTIAYEFKPDGTAFSAGLTFKVTFKNKDSVIPIPFLISKKNGIEPVSDAEIVLDLTKKETTISVPMKHFSVLIFPTRSASAFFSATMDVPDQVYIDDVVTAKATLNKNIDSVVLFSELNPWAVPVYDDNNRPLLSPHMLGYKVARDSVHVWGKVNASGLVVGPAGDFYGYPEDSLFTGESLSVKSREHRCVRLGRGGVFFRFGLTYDATAVDVISGGQPGQPLRVGSSLGLKKYNKSGHGFVSAYKELECVARPSVQGGTGSGASESESKAVGDILDEDQSQVPPASQPPGTVKICGLPGGEPCQKL